MRGGLSLFTPPTMLLHAGLIATGRSYEQSRVGAPAHHSDAQWAPPYPRAGRRMDRTVPAARPTARPGDRRSGGGPRGVATAAPRLAGARRDGPSYPAAAATRAILRGCDDQPVRAAGRT